jgi:hypothetical protein
VTRALIIAAAAYAATVVLLGVSIVIARFVAFTCETPTPSPTPPGREAADPATAHDDDHPAQAPAPIDGFFITREAAAHAGLSAEFNRIAEWGHARAKADARRRQVARLEAMWAQPVYASDDCDPHGIPRPEQP